MGENICNIHNTKNINVYTLGNILKSLIKDQTPNVNKNGQKLWIGNSAKKFKFKWWINNFYDAPLHI